MRGRLLVTAVLSVTVAVGVPSGTAGPGGSAEILPGKEKIHARFVDLIRGAVVKSPHLDAVTAKIEGMRGVSIPDRPGRPAHVPRAACSVGWGTFKKSVTSSRAILAPPGTTVTYVIEVPEGGRLELSGLAWDPGGKAAGEVAFEVRVAARGLAERTVSSFSVPVRDRLVYEEQDGKSFTGPGRQINKENRGGDPKMRTVDLSGYGGKRIELTLATLPDRSKSGGPAAAFWLDPVMLGPSDYSGPGTIILAVVDSMKKEDFDLLSGDPSGSFGRLRAQGTSFAPAFSNSTWTRPSSISMLTSRDPYSIGLPLGDYAVGWEARKFYYSLDHVSLPERLRETGAACAAFGDNVFISPTSELGVDLGFDMVHFSSSRRAAASLDEALDWAAERKMWPLFIYLHLPGAHYPRKPPMASYLKLLFRHPRLFFSEPSVYASLLSSGDDLMNFIEQLEATKSEGTLLLLTSDHGRPEVPDGRYGAKGVLSEEMLKVPLLLRGPGIDKGTTAAGPVELMDIMPGVLAYAGIAGGDEGAGPGFPGAGRGGMNYPDRSIFAVGASPDRPVAAINGDGFRLVGEGRHDPTRADGRDPSGRAGRAPRDYTAVVLDFLEGSAPISGEIRCRGRITWVSAEGFIPGDSYDWKGGGRLLFDLVPGSGKRRIIFRAAPEGAPLSFDFFSAERRLEAIEIGLGPLAARPGKVPFRIAGGRRRGLLHTPFYPAVLDDGTDVNICLVPWQRLLSATGERAAVPGSLGRILESWGYKRSDGSSPGGP